jgi:hypothetical protein
MEHSLLVAGNGVRSMGYFGIYPPNIREKLSYLSRVFFACSRSPIRRSASAIS